MNQFQPFRHLYANVWISLMARCTRYNIMW